MTKLEEFVNERQQAAEKATFEKIKAGIEGRRAAEKFRSERGLGGPYDTVVFADLTRLEKDGRFDVISVCPITVLGPLLSRVHERTYSWQWYLGRMLAGKPCGRQWNALWNIVDVRDVGESQALMIESNICKNGWRYQLSATDESGEIDALQLQAHLQKLFPDINVGGPPDEYYKIIEKYGAVYQSPLAQCDKAREELGLKTHTIEDTLYQTGKTMIDLELVKPAYK